MLNIGVIGLGNIAQKAYLPVYAHMRRQVNWLMVNRGAPKSLLRSLATMVLPPLAVIIKA